jgi:glycine/D-amino acid oxidase-like deaminating enzyme
VAAARGGAMSGASLWLADEAWSGLPALVGERRFEVAVVGAGVTGAVCALRLRALGRSVAVLEARRAAAGASGRNAGFATAGTALGLRPAERLLGVQAALALERLTAAARERLLELAAELDAGAARRSGLLVLAGEQEAAELEADVRRWRAAGLDAELAPERIPEPLRRRFVQACWRPDELALQPARWVRALVRAALVQGALFYERSPVRALVADGGGWRLETDGGRLRTEAVVVCCDGLSARLLPELSGVVYPVRGQVLATRPLAEPPIDCPVAGDGGHLYALPSADGRIVLGGRRDADRAREYADTEELNGTVQAALDTVLRDDLGLSPRLVERRWAGIMGFTPDMLPVVGELPGRPRRFVAAGYSGSGNVQGFLCGELVAELVCGRRRPAAEPYGLARFIRDGRLLQPSVRIEEQA